MSELLGSDGPFEVEERRTLLEIVDAIIPAQENRPGAADEQIFAEILHTATPAVTPIRAVIYRVQSAGMDAVVNSQASDVRVLVSIVVQCYYRDDRVMESIDMEPRAPFPEGFEMVEDDWSLLEPVRERGRLYRGA